MADTPSPERWLPVVGYEAAYEVSDLGRLRALARLDSAGRRRTGGMLRPSVNDRGYHVASLSRDGQERSVKVHNLVLAAFVGPRPVELPETRHLDDDRSNNALSNLAYGTHSENSHDSIEHGTHARACATYCANDHEYTADNTLWIGGRRRCRTCRAASQRADRVRRTARERAAREATTHA